MQIHKPDKANIDISRVVFFKTLSFFETIVKLNLDLMKDGPKGEAKERQMQVRVLGFLIEMSLYLAGARGAQHYFMQESGSALKRMGQVLIITSVLTVLRIILMSEAKSGSTAGRLKAKVEGYLFFMVSLVMIAAICEEAIHVSPGTFHISVS